MSTIPSEATRRHQRGVTLIEVLITMVVLAIGLLGFSALQTVAMKSNRTALYRSYATMAAYDVLDCMRANHKAAREHNYDIAFDDAAPTSTSTIADADLKSWLDALATNLPDGDGQIVVDSNGVATVEVQWSEGTKADGTTLNTATFKTQSSLRP